MKQFVLLFLFAAAFWGGEYVRRELWEPDEARFAYVTGEMVRDGHWAVPHRHGEFYAHKPPMLFWLQRGFSHLTGGEVNSVSARLPSFLGALLTLWITGLFARRWLDEAARWRAILILATSMIFWHEGGMGRMDALLCGLELSALYLLLWNNEAPAAWRTLTAYACMGLAILTKGPVGLLVPLGAYIAITWASCGPRALARAHLIWGPLLALLFPAAWFFAAYQEGAPAAYFRELVFKQNIGRLKGEELFSKPRPVYFYLVHVLSDFMPWTLFLPAMFATWRLQPESTPARRKLWAWFLLVVIFFTLSSGKRNLYILAAYPALSLLLAGAWPAMARLARRWQAWTAGVATATTGLLGLAALAAPLYWQHIPRAPAIDPLVAVPAGLALLAGSLVCRQRFRSEGLGLRWFRAFAVTFCATLASVGLFVFPALNPIKTPRSIVAAVQREVPPDAKLLIFGETTEIVPLYCERSSRSATDVVQLQLMVHALRRGAIICTQEAWQDVLAPRVPEAYASHEFTIGRKRLVWAPFHTTREGP
jgi:4-amino-4-deoxy-L-arabinose transferase-like glycosyltransferase